MRTFKTIPIIHTLKTCMRVLCLFGLVSLALPGHAASISMAGTTNNLDVPAAWVGGVVPGSGDIAVWDSNFTTAQTNVLGASASWAGIQITGAQGAVGVNPNVSALPFSTVSGSSTLTYSNGAPANPLVNGDQVYIGATNVGFTLGPPATYYVVNATTTTFQLSATPGGTAINATQTQASPKVLPTVTGGLLTIGASGIDTSAAAYPLVLNCPVMVAVPQTWNLTSGLIINGGLMGANASGNDVTLNGSGTLSIVGGAGMTLSNLVVNSGVEVNPQAGGSGIITLNGGSFFVNPPSTVNLGVYVTALGGTIRNNVNRTWNGNLTGSGPLTVNVRGNYMQWGGNNTNYTGTISIGVWNGAGGLRLNGVNTVSATTAYTMDFGAQAYMVANGAGIYNLGSLSGGGYNSADSSGYIGTAAGQDFSIGALNTSTTFSGNIKGAGRIIKTGTGTLTLDHVITAGTYTGSTVISNGVLQVGSGGASGLLGSGNVTNYSSLVFNVAGNQTFANAIAGTGSLTNIGSGGKVTLAGAISYSGPTFITAGELAIGSASQLTNTITVGDGATLGAVPATASATVTEGAVNFGSGCGYEFNLGTLSSPTSTSVVSNTANVNLNGNVTVNLTATNSSLTSGISTITLLRYASRSGPGNFVLGALPYKVFVAGAGLVDDTVNKEVRLTINVIPPVSDARIWVGDANGVWDSGNLANKVWKVASSGLLTNYNEGDEVLFDDTATGTTIINMTGVRTPSGITVANTNLTYTFGGSGAVSGSTGLLKRGPGTLIATNANSYGGMTVIQNGTLVVAGRGSIGSGGVTNYGTLVLDLSNAGASYTLPFFGQINGTGSVIILGMDQNNSVVQMNIADAIGTGVAGNPYTGGTTISNAYVQLVPNPLDNSTRSAAKSTGLGTNTITFLGTSTLELADWGVLTDSGGAGVFAPPINVPIGQTGTLKTAGRMGSSGAVTGGGTFNLGVTSTRDDINCNFSAFTGQINVFPNGTADFRIGNGAGFPLAKLHLAANLTTYSQAGSGTIFRVGELSGDAGSVFGGGNNCTWQVGALNTSTTNAANIGGGETISVIKEGTGTWTLSGADSYSGNTTISNGVLALIGETTITNSPTVSILSPGILDVSGTTSGTMSLGSNSVNQTLQGNGTINGSFAVGSLGTVKPGFASALGTLTVTNAVTLGGTTLMKLSRAAVPNSDQIAAQAIAAGGTLAVTNIGAALQVGDTFQLFSKPVSGAFAVLNLQTNDTVNYQAYTWNNRLAVDGTIVVQTVIPTVNPNPAPIKVQVSGNQLTLSWPVDHQGWRLLVQTNSLNTGLGTNWVAVPNSQNVTNLTVTMDPANGTVFYRMIYP